MNREEALQALDRYEDLSKDFGYPNQASLQAIRKIVLSLRSGPVRDSYFFEKLASLEHWADIGFSTRKFQKYRGGAEQVRVFALGDLSTAKWCVEQHWPT